MVDRTRRRTRILPLGVSRAAALLAALALLAACTQADDEDGDEPDQAAPAPGEDDVPTDDPGDGELDEDTTPDAPDTTVSVRAADLEDGEPPAYLDTSVAEGFVDLYESHDDHPAAMQAVYDGEGINGYARVQVEVDWDEGDEVSYGVDVYLPEGFLDAQQGAIDLIRWDNWVLDETTTDHGGVALTSDGLVRLISERLDVTNYETLVGTYEMPEEQWVRIEVEQRLSEHDGEAYNELRVDGELIGTSDEANLFGRPITALRAGIVSIDSGTQQNRLELYFDDVVVDPVVTETG